MQRAGGVRPSSPENTSRMRWLFTAAVAATFSTAAAAQVPAEVPVTPRVRITPFVGATLPLHVSGSYVLADSGNAPRRFREVQSGSVVAGAEVEVPLHGRFSAVGALSTSGRGNVTTEIYSASDTTAYTFSGPRSFFARAGLRYRLPEPAVDNRRHRPSGSVTVAPAIVHQNYESGFFGELRGGTTDNLIGVSLGADAASRLGSGPLSLHIGLEDFVTWNAVPYGRRIAEFAGRTREVEVGIVNTLVIRAGLTYDL